MKNAIERLFIIWREFKKLSPTTWSYAIPAAIAILAYIGYASREAATGMHVGISVNKLETTFDKGAPLKSSEALAPILNLYEMLVLEGKKQNPDSQGSKKNHLSDAREKAKNLIESLKNSSFTTSFEIEFINRSNDKLMIRELFASLVYQLPNDSLLMKKTLIRKNISLPNAEVTEIHDSFTTPISSAPEIFIGWACIPLILSAQESKPKELNLSALIKALGIGKRSAIKRGELELFGNYANEGRAPINVYFHGTFTDGTDFFHIQELGLFEQLVEVTTSKIPRSHSARELERFLDHWLFKLLAIFAPVIVITILVKAANDRRKNQLLKLAARISIAFLVAYILICSGFFIQPIFEGISFKFTVLPGSDFVMNLISFFKQLSGFLLPPSIIAACILLGFAAGEGFEKKLYTSFLWGFLALTIFDLLLCIITPIPDGLSAIFVSLLCNCSIVVPVIAVSFILSPNIRIRENMDPHGKPKIIIMPN